MSRFFAVKSQFSSNIYSLFPVFLFVFRPLSRPETPQAPLLFVAVLSLWEYNQYKEY